MNAPLTLRQQEQVGGAVLPGGTARERVFGGHMRSLAAVHRGWGSINRGQGAWLRDQGVSPEAIIEPDPIGAAWVRFLGDATFEAAKGTEPLALRALTFRVVDGDEIIDLAAWSPRTGQIGIWRGVGFALGQEAIFNPATFFDGEALRLHATPLEWLQSGRDGICIVRWKYTYAYLRNVPRLFCADPQLAYQLERWCRPPTALPKILVPDLELTR